MRQPHYWKRAGHASAPSEICVLDTEATHGENARVKGGELQHFILGVAVFYRLEKGRRTRERWLHFTEPDAFWEMVQSRLSKNRPLWIFGHNLPYDLGQVGGWRILTSGAYEVSKDALEGMPFFIMGHLDGKPLNFCDTFNYYHCSLAQMGKAVGLPKLDMPEGCKDQAATFDYCHRDVEITAASIDSLIRFVREHELGPWGPTIASLSFNAYRHRFMSHKVLVHCYREPLKVERGCYYGGIVDTAYVGAVPDSPVYQLDVCSMYPYCCTRPLPTKFVSCRANPHVGMLNELVARYMVFADVTLSTERDTYPVRWNGRVYYPVGTYRTNLAHPELCEALERGHVVQCHFASWHESGTIFKDYMEFFVRLKTEYHKAENPAYRQVCKYYATNLYGKTGQLTPKWQRWSEEAMMTLEVDHGLKPGALAFAALHPPTLYRFEESVSFPDHGLRLKVRDYWGFVEVMLSQQESRDSCPAIAAAVTSYGRVYLRMLQRIAGPGNWFYSDTDSIFCNQTGLDNLTVAGYVQPDTLGFLGVENTWQTLTVYGPKDYKTDGKIKLKGIKRPDKPNPDGSFSQLHFPSAKQQLFGGVWPGVFVKQAIKTLRRTVDRVNVGPDGWATPLVWPQQQPPEKGNGRTA